MRSPTIKILGYYIAELWGFPPISPIEERLVAFRENFGQELIFKEGDLRNYDFVLQFFRFFQPEAIVHLGEMPSAPYSMIGLEIMSTRIIIIRRYLTRGRLLPLVPSLRRLFTPEYTLIPGTRT